MLISLGSFLQEKPELSRERINEWISEKTNKRINNTLPEGSIDINTILVLVNTIYFKVSRAGMSWSLLFCLLEN